MLILNVVFQITYFSIQFSCLFIPYISCLNEYQFFFHLNVAWRLLCGYNYVQVRIIPFGNECIIIFMVRKSRLVIFLLNILIINLEKTRVNCGELTIRVQVILHKLTINVRYGVYMRVFYFCCVQTLGVINLCLIFFFFHISPNWHMSAVYFIRYNSWLFCFANSKTSTTVGR